MRAYIVTENDENTGDVIFAKDKRTALRIGANAYGDGEIEYVTATRAKALDRHEGQRHPGPRLDRGRVAFRVPRLLDADRRGQFYDARRPVSGVVGIEGRAVYCCHTCRMDHLAREAAIKAYGDAFQDMLRDNRGLLPEDMVRGLSRVGIEYELRRRTAQKEG